MDFNVGFKAVKTNLGLGVRCFLLGFGQQAKPFEPAQNNHIAPIFGLGELYDTAQPANTVKPCVSLRPAALTWLYHTDQAVGFEGIINHIKVARFENIER